MKTLLPAVTVFAFVASSLLVARAGAAETDLARRIEQLEAETQALRAELERTPGPAVRLPQLQAAPVGPFELAVEEAMDDDSLPADPLRAGPANRAWTKGDFTVVPYGSLWGSVIYVTGRTAPGAYTLFVPSVDAEGEDSLVIDTRRTRLGLDVTGPRVPFFDCAESGGKIEIDFHGAFVVENKPGVLLRHGYGEVKNERFRLLAGQTWDVISPLYPSTLNYSVGWGGGNIGYRRAQVRLERFFACSDTLLVTAQGSLNQNIVSDFATVTDVDAESSDWPVIEGRMAFTLGCRDRCSSPVTWGVSGHVGEQGFDFTEPGNERDDARVRTWSLNVDLYAPLSNRMGIKGEFFTGENLGTFLGGVIQGVSLSTRDGIRSTGGWCDFWYDWTCRAHSHLGYSIDDPVDGDVPGGRTYNQFFFTNFTYDVTEKLIVGAEVTSWKTLHDGARPGDSVQFEFTGYYGF